MKCFQVLVLMFLGMMDYAQEHGTMMVIFLQQFCEQLDVC
jgi:hypothetical protein